MNGSEKRELPWWQKYTLTLNEASEYFGIGYKKLELDKAVCDDQWIPAIHTIEKMRSE